MQVEVKLNVFIFFFHLEVFTRSFVPRFPLPPFRVATWDRKTLVLELLFNKVGGLKAYNCIKKEVQHMCFHVNGGAF